MVMWVKSWLSLLQTYLLFVLSFFFLLSNYKQSFSTCHSATLHNVDKRKLLLIIVIVIFSFYRSGQFLFSSLRFPGRIKVSVCSSDITHLSITSRLKLCLYLLSVNFIILHCDWLKFVEFVKFFSLSLCCVLFLHDALKAQKTQWTASAGNIYLFGTWPFFPSFCLEYSGVQSDSYTLRVFLSDPEKKPENV